MKYCKNFRKTGIKEVEIDDRKWCRKKTVEVKSVMNKKRRTEISEEGRQKRSQRMKGHREKIELCNISPYSIFKKLNRYF